MKTTSPSPTTSTSQAVEPPRVAGTPVFSAKALFGEARVVVIEHRGAHYQRRLTRQGKLILTK